MVNNPPETPDTPTGHTSGKAGTTCEFSSNSVDQDGDYIYYMFEWGDGTTSGWRGPYQSGAQVVCYHAYDTRGEYSVRVKAIDDPDRNGDLSDGIETGWSNGLTVSISNNKPVRNLILEILERIMDRFPLLEQFFDK